jgi:hypothetical protein
MASIPIQNAPQDLTMLDFRAINDRFGSLAKSHRFAARVRPTGQYMLPFMNFAQDLTYLCEVGELPGRAFMNIDVRYYGPNQKLPFQSSYEDISLNFLCRTQSLERQFFDDWQLIINPINTFDFNYRDDYACEIDLYQYAEDSVNGGFAPAPMYWIKLHNAYPILVNPQPMTWADDQFQRLIVSFTYTHWSRPGLDPLPSFDPDLVVGRNNIR